MSNQRFSITPAVAAKDMKLSDSVHRTLSVIGIHGDENGWCWPSQSTLAKMRGVSRKTINVHIKALIGYGYLNIAPRYDDETGAQRSNMMQIKFDFVPNVTGGVTPKTLQGVSPSGGYRGGKVQEVTHNDPSNDPSNDNNKNESPIQELVTCFKELSYCRVPKNGKFESDWLAPLVAIYKASGEDFDTTKLRIETAVTELKASGYSVVSPGSIQNMAVNLGIHPKKQVELPEMEEFYKDGVLTYRVKQ
ncbi:MAG: helix-turn-helix domain-containing protein [Ketobacter sp.]|nr:helix-turn-helix domain-containing protein [Ketobacter sp.]